MAFIRANCKSVATCRAAEESFRVGSQEEKAGTEILTRIPITARATRISMTVNPRSFRLHGYHLRTEQLFMADSAEPKACQSRAIPGHGNPLVLRIFFHMVTRLGRYPLTKKCLVTQTCNFLRLKPFERKRESNLVAHHRFDTATKSYFGHRQR